MRKVLISLSFVISYLLIFFSLGAVMAKEKPNVSFSQYNAKVDAAYTGVDGAVADGIKTYRTIQDALDGAPAEITKPYVIFIKNGIYDEKLTIDKPCITFLGESRQRTKLTHSDVADTKKPDGKASYGTTGSATVTIKAENFRVENMTIANGFDYPGNFKKLDNDPTRMKNVQGVAVKTEVGSDKAIFYQCNILGYQDTLYANSGRQYYKQCYISGNVDFIFGAGQAIFDDCDIVSLPAAEVGYVTASSTSISKQYGLVFMNCRLKKGTGLADATTSLGRPWHPTVTMPDGSRQANPDSWSAVTYLHCYMDSHISTEGWESMSGRDKAGKIIWFSPEDSRFYEYKSIGPGVVKSDLRLQLSDLEASDYTIENIFDGWKPLEK